MEHANPGPIMFGETPKHRHFLAEPLLPQAR